MTRILAIGDVHGHSKALRHLLRFADVASNDVVITLGDYVNRGPDSRGVIECLLELQEKTRLIPLLGNHEIMMTQAPTSTQSLQFWIECGGNSTLLSYGSASVGDVPEQHWNFLKSCRRYHEEEQFFFVHANVDASLPLKDQPDSELFWRHLEFAPWHVSGKIMVCGHTPQVTGTPLHLERAICIDTDIEGSGWLTCIEPKTLRCWQARDSGETRLTLLEAPDDDWN